MSTSSRSSTDDSIFDLEELLHIEARCRELRREKDLLKETQAHSFDLIKRLEQHVGKLNKVCLKDKSQIQTLQRELSNCHQEIDYLQDQLNARSTQVSCLQEHVGSLQKKVDGIELLEEEVFSLREELYKSNSECDFMMNELENKETELRESSLQIEKLEDSFACAALEYQCEIESMRLDMLTLEQKCIGVKKFEEESSPENSRLNGLVHDLELRLEDDQKTIKNLANENKHIKDMLVACQEEAKFFCKRVEEHFNGWLESKEATNFSIIEENKPSTSNKLSPCGQILQPLLSKVLEIKPSEIDLKTSINGESSQLDNYEKLVKQLQEEIKREKVRAKDEAEDLAQEMAELRYQMTELLEEERKRRACIEQASLQRISELETQLQVEQRKSVAPISHHICES